MYPDFILLYMVCAQLLTKQVLYDLFYDPMILSKHWETDPTALSMGQLVLWTASTGIWLATMAKSLFIFFDIFFSFIL